MATNVELKEQQRRQWGGSAESWDRSHERLEGQTRPVTDWLCREAGLAPGMRVLDLACGSGHPSLIEARLVSPGGSVVATDLTQEMVEVTRRRAAELGLTNIEARVMDMEAIDFPDASFDAATCRFGLMFCPEPLRAASEVRRVLRTGGRFALSVWDEPSRSPAQAIATEALRRFGRPQPPVDYGLPGVFQLAPAGKLESVLREAGFRSVRVEPLPLTWEYESLDDYMSSQRGAPVRELLAEASAEEAARFREILAEVLQPFTKGGIVLRAQPLCAVAQK